jgi:hypothetical protein
MCDYDSLMASLQSTLEWSPGILDQRPRQSCITCFLETSFAVVLEADFGRPVLCLHVYDGLPRRSRLVVLGFPDWDPCFIHHAPFWPFRHSWYLQAHNKQDVGLRSIISAGIHSSHTNYSIWVTARRELTKAQGPCIVVVCYSP